eukprot:TRINITY_DN3286_c1_g10_i1.p1 TRINITY_DN3286_c1_g10~~TRINITY_DN3286_c1_g10_i1.p1  ORF type:complete len:702 (+),score=162.94 TRINITY_DN3286_c1_g10_i1:24-2129(+)
MFKFYEADASREFFEMRQKSRIVYQMADENSFEKLENFFGLDKLKISSEEFELDNNYFKIGGFGVLHKAKRHGKDVIIKFFIDKIADDELRRECFPMILNHSFIRQVFGVTEIDGKIGVVMEYCDAVLEDMISELSLKEKLIIMMQVASALDYCQGRSIAHRDLKPNNILLRLGANGIYTPAIADFGLLRDASRSSANSMMGAARYAAPELANEQENIIGTAIDAWSFGVMLAQVVSGFVPFYGLSELKVVGKLIKFELPYDKELLDNIPCFGIIKKCLAVDPTKRPSFCEITEYLKMLILRFEGLGFDEYRLKKRVEGLEDRMKSWILEKKELTEQNRSLLEQVEVLLAQNKKLEETLKGKSSNNLLDAKQQSANDFYFFEKNDVKAESLSITFFGKSEKKPIFDQDFPDIRVQAIDYSSDGRFFAVGSFKKKLIRIYDSTTHEILIEKEFIQAFELKFSKDSKLLVVGGQHSIIVIEVDTWRRIMAIDRTISRVTSVCVSSDNNFVVVGMYRGYIAIYSIEGALIQEFQPHRDHVRCVRCSDNLKYFASVSQDGCSKLFSFETGEELHRWNHDEKEVVSGNFSSDGRFWTTGDEDGSIRIFDVENRELFRRFNLHKQLAYSVIFSHDDTLLYTCSKDKSLKVTHVETGQVFYTLKLPFQICSLAINHNETRLLCAICHSWRSNKKAHIQEFKGRKMELS